MKPEEIRDKVWVSYLNDRPEVKAGLPTDQPVRFYDTTLRDGEQTVGVVFTPEQKLAIARKLDELGVSRIEAGFPRVSREDARAFESILKADLRAEVWGFSRAVPADLQELFRLGARHTVIEVPTSDIKLEAYGLSRETILQRLRDAIHLAKDHQMTVAFFTVDGTRTELSYLSEVYQCAREAGADEVVVVDTIGACAPEAVQYLVAQVRHWVGDSVPIHFHGHNDFGLATASAVAAVRGGAGWIQGTINGMGERAGNADIGEVALALSCLYQVPVELDLTRLREVSRLVQEAAGYEVDAWKPAVGRNLFVRESGAVASQFHLPEAIEPYSAQLVRAERCLVLGKKSGLDSIQLKARELGLHVPPERAAAVLAEVKKRGTRKRGLVEDDEFRSIVQEICSR